MSAKAALKTKSIDEVQAKLFVLAVLISIPIQTVFIYLNSNSQL